MPRFALIRKKRVIENLDLQRVSDDLIKIKVQTINYTYIPSIWATLSILLGFGPPPNYFAISNNSEFSVRAFRDIQ